MKKKKFKFPNFDKMTYEEEATWWDKHDLTEFWDELDNVDMIVNLHQPKQETLVVRLQKNVKDKLELTAKNKGVNVSALARMWLMEKLQSNPS